jgi:hypothetical protein
MRNEHLLPHRLDTAVIDKGKQLIYRDQTGLDCFGENKTLCAGRPVSSNALMRYRGEGPESRWLGEKTNVLGQEEKRCIEEL